MRLLACLLSAFAVDNLLSGAGLGQRNTSVINDDQDTETAIVCDSARGSILFIGRLMPPRKSIVILGLDTDNLTREGGD